MTDSATATQVLTGPRELASFDGYQLVLATSTELVERTAWNAVAQSGGGSVFHMHEWHTAFAEAPPGDMSAAHVLAYRGDELVGICPAYLVRQCPRLEYMMSLSRPASLALNGPVLLAHSLAALGGGPLAIGGAADILRALDHGLRVAASVLGAAAWGYANIVADAFAGWLLGQGYAVAQIATGYCLPVKWQTPTAYWAALPRHRRHSLRGEQYRTARSGIRVAIQPLPRREAAALVRDFLTTRGTPAEVLPDRLLNAMLTHLAHVEHSIGARDADGRLVACFAGWRFGDTWSLWFAGLDTLQFDAFTPYHAMMGAVVDAAIADKVTTVDLGRANGTVKRRYGARARPLLLALRSTDRGSDAALHLWARMLERHHHAALNGLETTSRCC